jgi:hypothetical protein
MLSLSAVLLAACAPAALTSPPVAATEPPTAILPTETVAPIVQSATAEVIAGTQSPEATALPVATSRGPDLHATDPGTVRLASGGLQFVEFFRFT